MLLHQFLLLSNLIRARQHPLVARAIKTSAKITWNVATVTTYIESLKDNTELFYAKLTQKTEMFFALTRPSRSADLFQLDLRLRSNLPEGVIFQSAKLVKQSRQSKPIAEFSFRPSSQTNCSAL